MSSQIISILSGKGGAGKTIIGLAMARVLSEAGLRCLFVDCDIATHGATYFFETELNEKTVSSLADFMREDDKRPAPLETAFGFYFLPSTLSPASDKFASDEGIPRAFEKLRVLADSYDVCILDCHAGYSKVVFEAVRLSNRNLIVLEPDAVSGAALRVLYLQIGLVMNASNTWQIFNKLTEEERPSYEKVFGGTLFANLPPIPFDWNVRAAFAMREVPGIATESSAFGLGVLRIMKTLFPSAKVPLEELEERTVGRWYESITKSLASLEEQKEKARFRIFDLRRELNLRQARRIAALLSGLGGLTLIVALFKLFGINLIPTDIVGSPIFLVVLAVALLFAGTLYYQSQLGRISLEESSLASRESLAKVESEIKRYQTLILTDPRLRELSRRRDSIAAHDDILRSEIS
jgi:MinD-like ATPase involved in chromosome partitioning or flagellar assembly